MRPRLSLFHLLLTAMVCVACSQEVATDSNAATGTAGDAAGAIAPNAGSTAGAAAISGRGPTSAGGSGRETAGASSSAGASGRGLGSGGAGAGVGTAAGTGAAGSSAGQAGFAAAAGSGGVPASGTAGSAAAGGGAAGGGGASAPGAAYQPCPLAEPCRILPLGDSITFGIGYSGGYRVELFRKATADGKKITFTGSVSNGPMMVDGAPFPRSNEGHSGWKIDQLLPLIPMPALQPVPHIVLLMIGTNDIAQNDDLSNAPRRLGGLIDKLSMNAPDALIVVAKVTPLSRSMAVQTYNAAIPPLVEERAAAGKHVIWVDQFTGFPTSELGDGVHPNQKGYERMAGVWYGAIGDLLR